MPAIFYKLSPRASILRWWRHLARPSRYTAALSHSLRALLLLLVEQFLLLVVEQIADLFSGLLLDRQYFRTHRLPVDGCGVHQILHLLSLSLEDRLDLCELVGRQVEILFHLLQAVVERH